MGVFCGRGVCGVYKCIWAGWLGVLEAWGCNRRRGRRETTPLYHIRYIKFISSYQPDKDD